MGWFWVVVCICMQCYIQKCFMGMTKWNILKRHVHLHRQMLFMLFYDIKLSWERITSHSRMTPILQTFNSKFYSLKSAWWTEHLQIISIMAKKHEQNRLEHYFHRFSRFCSISVSLKGTFFNNCSIACWCHGLHRKTWYWL